MEERKFLKSEKTEISNKTKIQKKKIIKHKKRKELLEIEMNEKVKERKNFYNKRIKRRNWQQKKKGNKEMVKKKKKRSIS